MTNQSFLAASQSHTPSRLQVVDFWAGQGLRCNL